MKIRVLLGWLLISCIVTSLFIYHQWGPPYSFLFAVVNTSLNASEQYIVYTCDGSYPCGGWADRQKGIVTAYMLSHMLGRKFKIKMTKPCNLSTHLQSNDIDWDIMPGEFRGLSTQYVKAIDRQDKMAQAFLSSKLETRYTGDVVYITTNMEYVEYLLNNTLYANKTEEFNTLTLDEVYVHVLRRMFKLKPNLQKQFDEFDSKIPRSKGIKLVCAQVRLGKNPTLPRDTETFNSLESVSAIWNFLADYNDVNKYRIFVTSDSETVRSYAQANFSANIVDLKGVVVHIDRPTGQNVCSGFAKVILDQLLLSTCDVLVISRSGLSRVAAWYRGKSENTYCFTKSKVILCDPFNLKWLFPSW